MRIPKRYGQSKIDKCPFCERTATTKNLQGIPVCESHKKNNLENLKCACGEWLDVQTGKYGAYFRCFNCGNVSFQKAMEMNPHIEEAAKKENANRIVTRTERAAETKFDQIKYQHKTSSQSSNQLSPSQKQASPRKETIIRSDDPNYF